MSKISLMPSLLSATGWFIGLLAVMILVTVLFAMVLVIALKPINKFGAEDDMPKKLERRETELTIELLKNSNDPKKTEALLKELREVTAAEKTVNRILERENAAQKDGSKKPAAKKASAAKQKPAEQAKPQPAQTQQQAQAKPQPAQPQQQAQAKPQPAQPQQQAQAKPQPAQPQQQAQAKPQPAQPQHKAPQQTAAQQQKPQQAKQEQQSAPTGKN